MANPDPDSVGARIAAFRKVRHLTQRGLADRANISYSLMFKIEQGDKPASPPVLAALARALSVSVADLTGQPYVDALCQDRLDGLIQPIREALDLFDLGADDDLSIRSIQELVADADRMCGLIRGGQAHGPRSSRGRDPGPGATGCGPPSRSAYAATQSGARAASNLRPRRSRSARPLPPGRSSQAMEERGPTRQCALDASVLLGKGHAKPRNRVGTGGHHDATFLGDLAEHAVRSVPDDLGGGGDGRPHHPVVEG
ncbi:helix-turn-helix domain-containing protein [Kitasatospora sp. NPDC008050]|uniref:helix-turn-helix domain-containing protein n=1 Tax=Kitasatospora sp. NPDC008050 TaxID=3364021 RepID=UPI0036EC15B0